jgi:hypothetical protein
VGRGPLTEVPALIDLPPVGAGTAFVESATGYYRRHLEQEVRSALELRDVLGLPLTFFPPRIKEGINGVNQTTLQLVRALERATGRTDLTQMTLLGATPKLSVHLSLRTTRAWCVLCLRSIGTDLLISTLNVIDVCFSHGIKLDTSCPQGHVVRSLGGFALPKLCSHCGIDLSTMEPRPAAIEARHKIALELFTWLHSGRPFAPEVFATGLSDAIHRLGLGPAEYAALSGVSGRSVLRCLQVDGPRPDLRTVLKLAIGSKVSFEELMGSPVHLRRSPKTNRTAVSRRPTPQVNLARAAELRSELLKPVAQRRTLEKMAKDMGAIPAFFYRHLPADVARLVGEGKRHRSQSRRDRDLRTAAAIRRVTRRRRALDLPLTFAAVASEVGIPGLFLDSRFRDELRRARAAVT